MIDGKTAYSFSITPEQEGKIRASITHMKKNPDKISFGKLYDYDSQLEVYSYRNDLSKWFISLDLGTLRLQTDDWRKLFRIMNKAGHSLGLLGRKKRAKPRKKVQNDL